MYRALPALFVALLCSLNLIAQKDFPHDSSYYETYPHTVKGRIYLSQKYVHLNFPGKSDNVDHLEYKVNAKLNAGIGVSWHGISFSIFYGASLLNKKDEPKGKTKGLDLQLHVFPRKWAIDLLLIFPKGYYLDPKGFASADPNTYYQRPDLHQSLIGMSAYKVPNKRKFSYRAAISQTEWQKKSAGSLLYGGQAYYGVIEGDSALVPTSVQSDYPEAGIKKINFISIGPGIGYAYTWVIGDHFFVTGSMVANFDVNFVHEHGTEKKKNVSLNPAEVFKAAIGYNSSNWSISANWVGNGIWFKGDAAPESYFWPNGRIRIFLAKKFTHKNS